MASPASFGVDMFPQPPDAIYVSPYLQKRVIATSERETNLDQEMQQRVPQATS
jgi:hypothetical protein